MQTTAISHSAKTSSANASAAKDDPAGTLPFADMLNREMDRGAATSNAPATASAPAKNADSAAPATQAGSKQTDTETPDNSAQAPASSETQPQNAGDIPAHGKDATEEEDTDALAAASSELIALVANLSQPNTVTVAADAQQGKDVDTDVAIAKDGKGVDALQSVGTSAETDAAALAAAATQQAAGTQGIAGGTQDANAADAATAPVTVATDKLPTQADPATAKSNPEPIRIVTPEQRAVTMSAMPPGSDLKPDVASKGKRPPGIGELDSKAAQGTDRKAADTNIPRGAASSSQQPLQGAQNGTFTSPAEAQPHAMQAQPQHDSAAAIANLANTVAGMAASSPAALNQVQAAAAQVMDNLAPRVGTQEWNQALGQKVVWMANGEMQSASLTLNPPDLGPLQVVLSVTNNHATANFTAAQPEVRQALESAMPKLREMLGDAGIQLGQANVSAGTPNQQQGFQAPSQQSSRQASSSGTTGAIEGQARVAHVQPARSSGVGLVDTFA